LGDALFPIILTLIIAAFVYPLYKVRKAKKLLARLSAADDGWDADKITARAQKVCRKVRGAIDAGKVDTVKDLLVDGLYGSLKGVTAEQFGFKKATGFIIPLSTTISIIEVIDYLDDSKDRIGAYVSNITLAGRGSHGPPDELWTFCRKGDDWVVYDIDPVFNIFDKIRTRQFSERFDKHEKLVIVAEPEVPVDEAGGAGEHPTRKDKASGEKVKYRYGVGYKKDYVRNYRK